MDIRKVKKLIEMMQESDIGEIEIKEGEDSVRISRSTKRDSSASVSPAPQYFVPDIRQTPTEGGSGRRLPPRTNRKESSGPTSTKSGLDASVTPRRSAAVRVPDSIATDVAAGHSTVTAPMVGTFYEAPEPDAAPFVQAGSKINQGDTLCIIESMKMMNRIVSEYTGIVETVLVENASGVEYDQPLFVIKPVS